MSGKGKLTLMLTKKATKTKKLIMYGRSKNLNIDELINVAIRYGNMAPLLGPDLNPLHVACIRSKPDVVRALIEEGYDVNREIGRLDSYLRIAVDHGNISVVHLLLEFGADPNRMNRDGKTPIEAALSKNKRDKTSMTAIKVLLEAGVSVNGVTIKITQEKPLHLAVTYNLPLCASFLLQKGADGNATDAQGCTPLHNACYRNYPGMIRLLSLHNVKMHEENVINDSPLIIVLRSFSKDALDALVQGGCDINHVMLNGTSQCTAIHYATDECDLEKVRFLISLGADPNKKLYDGKTPLHLLSSRFRSKKTDIEKSKELGSLNILNFLIGEGANVNVTDKYNQTPLLLAVMNKYFRLAKQLILSDANLNFQFGLSGKIIFHTISSLNNDIIKLSLDYGADYNKKDADGLTPYHYAINNNVDIKFIKSFVQFGCPYNQDVPVWRKLKKHSSDECIQFFNCQEQFFNGIRKNNISMVQEAVDKGAVVSACSEECSYPLHLVARNGHNAILTLMLENGCPSNTVNEKGETALFVAAKQGHYDVCCTLLQFGACYNYHSRKYSKTPEMIAAESGHESIVDLFEKVAKNFHLASMKEKHLIKHLETVLSISYDEYLMYVNAINVKAKTLMSTALHFKHNENATEMIKLRLLASSAANHTEKQTANCV